MKLIWVQAIIDLPAANFATVAAFWAEVTKKLRRSPTYPLDS